MNIAWKRRTEEKILPFTLDLGGRLCSVEVIHLMNRLKNEQSLYLRQHAAQPVDWYPWGEAALAEAQHRDVPLLVSIGYSACHWCHVMAHECFEDPYIAELMNRHFVCVKVDREERPDVDQVYMEAVQMIQHQGGWPLNVFCLPDGRPFFGGTYFPPEDRGNGLIPWPQLIMRIADFYKRSRGEMEENADAIQKNILHGALTAAAGGGFAVWEGGLLREAVTGILGNHDDRYGGFGQAPKFPQAMNLNFLLTARRLPGQDEGVVAQLDKACRTTLRAMAHGGIYDQFGGGFARYSVDNHWLIPHFEKMLYDNALLIESYTRGWLLSRDPLFAAVVEETVEWLCREMESASGGYYASLDADTEGEEGRYYVWQPEQVDAALGPALARRIREAYHITSKGNFEKGFSNPALVVGDFSEREALQQAREQLRAYRESNRTQPARDSKWSLFWNSLAIRSLAQAGYYFGRKEWVEAARRGADFFWEHMVAPGDAGQALRLHSVYYEKGGAAVDGFLTDYATAAEALLGLSGVVDWIDPGQSRCYQQRALALLDAALERFSDSRNPGYFMTDEAMSTPVARRKEWFDNATPSGNSSLLHALSGASALTGEARYAREIEALLPAYSDSAGKVASGVAHALEAIATHEMGIAVIHIRPGVDPELLRAALAERPWRRTFVQLAAENAPADYQLCLGMACRAPTNDLEILLKEF